MPVKRAIKDSLQGNRGMEFENYIIQANARYRLRGIASIDKVATPVKVIKYATSGPKKGRITDGYFEEKSTVDFIGVSKGMTIAFDAKETKNKTSFPLDNIEDHQFEVLREKQFHEGISFLLIRFKLHHEIYILLFEDLENFWEEAAKGGRKSIPYHFFKKNCVRCEPGRNVAIDYLAALNKALLI
ncbi:Holliday junction resolvase RecU [Priestia flexa]|uniref:Holliday junction resolvase RecU n=1 Tax=Priestia flexa TaxID=86664 RepID=UPI00249068FD|nr:Holliday junction resolvase RecU [Priestia flexa]